jgi:hydroxypyruvate reductase
MTRRTSITIENRERIGGNRGADIALDCLATGVAAADPAIGIRESLSLDGSVLTVEGDVFDLSDYERIFVLGGGNAAGYATVAIEAVLDDLLDDGAVVTDNSVDTQQVQMLPGDHPIPSERGVESTRELLSLAGKMTERDLVIAPITGGGSALLVTPDGVTLDELQATTDALLASGATIHEINAVRKHLSAIKGGQLARRLAPATTIGLLCSDVVGDDRSVIASGPLTPDDSTYDDALAVLESYDVQVPDAVSELLRRGADGERPETPTPEASVFERVHTYVVASNATATAAAAETARDHGFTPHVLGSRLRGRAKEVAKVLVGIAEEVSATGTPLEPPAALISGGETTVEISGDGSGGPNQELAVSAALELADSRITFAAVDTDGIDGNASAAGGIVTCDTVDDRRSARAALDGNDTAPYLAENGASIRTGPTETNVNDLHVIVVEDEA